jgi:uncharacterized membrane protein
MSATADRLVAHYLKRLNRELRDVPRDSRREIVEEIEEHVAAGRAALGEEDDAAVREVLARLGEPGEIADDARQRLGIDPRGHGVREVFALIGLLAGGFVFVVGWFVGLGLLWSSSAWTTREKLVGSLIVPGGLLSAFLLLGLGATQCGGGYRNELTGPVEEYCTVTLSLPEQVLWVGLVAFCLVAPVCTTVFLARRMSGPAGDSYQPSAGSA